MSEPISRAFVEIVPSMVHDFSTRVKRDVNDGVKGIGQQVNTGVTEPLRRSADETGRHFRHTIGGIGSSIRGLVGPLLAVGAVAGGAGLLKGFIQAGRDAQKVLAQTNAVIKSTGGAAHVTAKDVDDLAKSISAATGIEDDVVKANENMLLTFTGVRNEVGKGNDIFDQATRAVTDMSIALGEDGKTASIQLGKALNDPIRGVSALQRVGVTLTQQQKDQVKAMVESGNTMGAQKLILHELSKEFGGSAAAQATAGDKMKSKWHELSQEIGTKLIPILDALEGWITDKVLPAAENVGKWIGDHWPQIGGFFKATWDNVIHPALKALASFFTDRVVPAAAAVVEWFRKHWSAIAAVISDAWDNHIHPALKAIGDFVTDKLVPAIQAFIDWFKENWPAIRKGFEVAWAHIKPIIEAMVDNLKTLWHKVLEPFYDWYKKHSKGVAETAKVVFGAMAVAAAVLAAFIKYQFKVSSLAITGFANTVGFVYRNLIKPAFDAITWVVKKAVSSWKTSISGVSDAVHSIGHFFHQAYDDVAKWVGKAVEVVTGIKGKVQHAFDGATTWLVNAGGDIVRGLWKGIKSLGTWLWKKIRDFVPGWIRSALGIKSPPAWAVDAGQWIARGLAAGIKRFPHFLENLAREARAKLGRLFSTTTVIEGHGQTSSWAGALQRYAASLFAAHGWAQSQLGALVNLWQGESGWNPKALNPSSGAYGIPQSLPASKMDAYGNRNDPTVQIRWGLDYIRAQYGTPMAAWSKWLSRSPHWYASGLAPTVFRVPTLIGVGERGAETVSVTPGRHVGDEHPLTAREFRSILEGGFHLTFDAEGLARMVSHKQYLRDAKGTRR